MRSGIPGLMAGFALLALNTSPLQSQVPAQVQAQAVSSRTPSATVADPGTDGMTLDVRDEPAALPAGATSHNNPSTGSLRRLDGRFPTTGSSAEQRATSFLVEQGARFGLTDNTSLQLTPSMPRSMGQRAIDVVRSTQLVHGFELSGHGLTVVLDSKGFVRAAHGVIQPTSSVPAPPALDTETTVATALSAAGLSLDDLRTTPSVRQVARLMDNGVELVHSVDVIRGLIPLALEVDAYSGVLLRVRENTTHGTGKFSYDDAISQFETGGGRGGVYKSVASALKQKNVKTTLKGVAMEDAHPALAPDGSLTGRYAQVVDDAGFIVISGAHDWIFDDASTKTVVGTAEYQVFDHVNTYSWLQRMGAYFSKRIGIFNANYTLLSYVNYGDGNNGYVNAFYSNSDPDGFGGYEPGFFVFGEFSNVTGDPMDDLSRDPTVVCHEYVHAVVDKEGVTLGDQGLDTPPRAVNEALADYFAASSLNTAAIGLVFSKFGGEVGTDGMPLRDLLTTRTLTDNLFDLVGQSTLLPEEHVAGEIFAAALWKARRSLKAVPMDVLVFDSLPLWPLSTAEVGFPVVTPANAQAAYEAFYLACFEAMSSVLDDGTPKGRRKLAALMGPFMSHGIIAANASVVPVIDATEGGLKIGIKSEFMGSLDEHFIDFSLGVGQQVSVTIKGAKGTPVDFSFDNAPASGDDPAEFTASKPKTTNAAGTKASQKAILVNTARTYRLTLSNTDASGGAYKLSIKVK